MLDGRAAGSFPLANSNPMGEEMKKYSLTRIAGWLFTKWDLSFHVISFTVRIPGISVSLSWSWEQRLTHFHIKALVVYSSPLRNTD